MVKSHNSLCKAIHVVRRIIRRIILRPSDASPMSELNPDAASDPRYAELKRWLESALGESAFTLERASEDASFRRYFRVRVGDATWIAMDAPPEREDCEPFVNVAALMKAAGLHVPDVIAQDLARGFLLLSDLGTTT